MSAAKPDLSRRDVLKVFGATTAVAAASSASAGCASMPAVGRGKGGHECDSHYCRYYRADRNRGRCALTLREAGGLP